MAREYTASASIVINIRKTFQADSSEEVEKLMHKKLDEIVDSITPHSVDASIQLRPGVFVIV